MHKKHILLFADYFYPGFKAGGPIQSIINFIDLLKNDFRLSVICRAHDYNSSELYDGIKLNQWSYIEKFNVEVYYTTTDKGFVKQVREILKWDSIDFVYFNSFFSPYFTIIPLFYLKKKHVSFKVLLSTRGELNSGAVSQKSFKKGIYLNVFKRFLADKIDFYIASSEEEKQRIKQQVDSATVYLLPNIPSQYVQQDNQSKFDYQSDFILLSRIAPIKNIHFILNVLMKVSKPCRIFLYGVLEDKEYWNQCTKLISKLPKHVQFEYKGSYKPNEVFEILNKSRFFISTTLGENFGHSIFESFISGTPVILSNTTPWRNLVEKKVGWDISLEKSDDWINTLELCLDIDSKTYNDLHLNCIKFADEFRNSLNLRTKYKNIFN